MSRHYNKPFSPEEKLKILNLSQHARIDDVALRYHCTVQSIYRWRRQYDGTIESLFNKSSRPLSPHPRAQTADEIKNISNLIRRNPDIGLNELYGKLRSKHSYVRDPVTLYRFLCRIGYYSVKKRKKPKYVPKPYDTPEQIGVKMQIDVKVVPCECYTGEYSDMRFYQYTAIDEATRERFIYPYREQYSGSSVDFLKRAIAYFGYVPDIVQTDNGQEFTYTLFPKKKEKHAFDIACDKFKIKHKLIRPRTPRHNGKVERSHRNDNERFYVKLKFYSYADLFKQMKSYLKRSNNIPSSVLSSRDKLRKWLTPKEKRKELLLLDWGVVE
ncbi:MAG: DDE-type integrase/transposase/recombinase [Clostridiales bacterium]|jgi:transposase InsO family protein/transposase-like protein|nr:DDE-type integrase/transposase/recombinase [Clostridiales bacterium]